MNNIEGKVCSKCGEFKEFCEFNKQKRSKDGLKHQCKSCLKEYYQRNKDKISEKGKMHYKYNKDKIAIDRKKYYQANKEKISERNKKYNKKYYLENKDKIDNKNKKYHQENKDDISNKGKKYYQENKDKIVDRVKEHYKTNKDKINEYRSEYYKNNKYKEYEYRKKYYQTQKGKEAIYKASLKRRSYKHKVNFTPHERKELLNRDSYTCKLCGIKVHDEKVNNETKAHVDHIIPISNGGNSDPSNLQILCRTCNLSKSDKIIV